MKPSRLVRWGLFAGAVVLALSLSGLESGLTGLAGAAAGALTALVLCLLSAWNARSVREAQGAAIVREVLSGTVVTFFITIAAILLVKWLWPDAVACFGLTAVGLYSLYRIAEGLSASRAAGARGVHPPGAISPSPTPTVAGASSDAPDRGRSSPGGAPSC